MGRLVRLVEGGAVAPLLERVRLEDWEVGARIVEGSGGDGGGHLVEVTLIRAGTSRNGNHYPESVLEGSVGLFEGVRAFADHASADDRPERSVRDLVGYYTDVGYAAPGSSAGDAAGRVTGTLHLLPGQEALWGLFREQALHPEIGICGLSIDALGEVKEGVVEGKKVRIVQSLNGVQSCDVVTRPSAGGGVERIVASDPGAGAGDGDGDEGEEDGDHDPMAKHAREHGLSAADRKRFATVVRAGSGGSRKYKFPIPPRGHEGSESHARAALSYIDSSDLTPGEKDHVRAKARAALGSGLYEGEGPGGVPVEVGSSVGERGIGSEAMRFKVKRAGAIVEVEGLEAGDEVVEVLEAGASAGADGAGVGAGETKVGEAASAPPEAPASAGAGLQEVARDELQEMIREARRERELGRCERALSESVVRSDLPEAMKARLLKRFDGKVFADDELREALQSERELLAALSADTGRVTGHNYEKSLVMGMSEFEQLQGAFDAMFEVQEGDAGKSIPRLPGIREAFRVATGRDIGQISGADAPLTEAFGAGLRNYVSHMRETGGLSEQEGHLREADVTTASFSSLLGTSMNKRLLKDYQAWPSEWQKFCSLVGVKDFKQQDRVRLGAFGSLSTVSEDAAYTTLTLADVKATYSATKRGNLVQISRETIVNDDLYAIRQIPQKLAASAAYTLAEFVYEFFDPNGPNIYDAHKLFDTTNHLNTGVATASLGTAASGTALASGALQTAIIKMRKQLNLASKPIGLKPRFLLVCPDLEFTAMTLLKSAGLPGGNNNDINPVMGFCEPIVSPQCNGFTVGPATTTSFCCVIADPRVIDTIEIGFVGGQVNPVLFIQDQPLYGINFTQDVISYKVRHEYGGAVVDYRGFYLINN